MVWLSFIFIEVYNRIYKSFLYFRHFVRRVG